MVCGLIKYQIIGSVVHGTWARFLWSRPQTTSYVVRTGPTRRRLKDRVCARAEMEQGPHGIGLTRRRSTSEKDHARAEMEQEQSKRDHARDRSKGTLQQKRVRQRRKSLLYTILHTTRTTRTTLRSLSSDDRFAIFIALPSLPLYLVPST